MKKILIYLMGVACVALAMSIILLIVNLCIPYAPISMEIFLPVLSSFGICIPILLMEFESEVVFH